MCKPERELMPLEADGSVVKPLVVPLVRPFVLSTLGGWDGPASCKSGDTDNESDSVRRIEDVGYVVTSVEGFDTDV